MKTPDLLLYKASFYRGKDPKGSLGIGKTIREKLKDHPICKTLNEPFINIKDEDLRDPDLKVWINPKNQFCFNAHLCSIKDIEEWMAGKGKMVRGESDEDKEKYWKYAVAEEEDTSGDIFQIRYFWKWFNRIPEDTKIIGSFSQDGSYRVHNPISIPRMRNGDSKRDRDEKVIVQVYSKIVKEIENSHISSTSLWEEKNKEKYRNIIQGACKSLILFGIGYYASSNSPTEISNFEWSIDLVLAKGRYKQLVAKGVDLPDFEWISKRN